VFNGGGGCPGLLNLHVKEGEFVIILCLNGEADGKLLVVQMLQEAVDAYL